MSNKPALTKTELRKLIVRARQALRQVDYYLGQGEYLNAMHWASSAKEYAGAIELVATEFYYQD